MQLLVLHMIDLTFFYAVESETQLKLIETTSLEKLGEKLTTDGPHKVEGTPRRVRGLLGGKYIFDTTAATYVWEHPYCTFYVFYFSNQTCHLVYHCKIIWVSGPEVG